MAPTKTLDQWHDVMLALADRIESLRADALRGDEHALAELDPAMAKQERLFGETVSDE
jgi:hypothetical protein